MVQECLYLAERFRSKQYIANSALDTISARLNLAASVSSLASLDSSCITIQVIYHSVRLPTACPYNRQAVPGWTCLPGPIKSSLTSENVHKLGYGQSHWWLSADLLLIEHCSVLSLLRPACHSRLHPPTSAPSPAALRHPFCKEPSALLLLLLRRHSSCISTSPLLQQLSRPAPLLLSSQWRLPSYLHCKL